MPRGNKDGKGTKHQFNGCCFKCNKWGHTKKKCPLNQQESGKESAPLTVVNQRSIKLLDQIVGDSIEVKVWIDGKSMIALLDTGSMISTISLQYCTSRGFELCPLDGLLTVESASGHALPYLGFVEESLRCQVQDEVSCALILVVPNTPYHEKIPVLLGTNVLK